MRWRGTNRRALTRNCSTCHILCAVRSGATTGCGSRERDAPFSADSAFRLVFALFRLSRVRYFLRKSCRKSIRSALPIFGTKTLCNSCGETLETLRISADHHCAKACGIPVGNPWISGGTDGGKTPRYHGERCHVTFSKHEYLSTM